MIYDHRGNPIPEEQPIEKSVMDNLMDTYEQMKDSGFIVEESDEFIGASPRRQDITVLPADNPKKLRMGWVVYEQVGVAVINDYAAANIVIGGPYIVSAERTVKPIIEMDDWISPDYWPEWKVVFDNDATYFVQAPNEEHAKSIAKKQHSINC